MIIKDWDFQSHPPPPVRGEGLEVKLIVSGQGLINYDFVMKPLCKKKTGFEELPGL